MVLSSVFLLKKLKSVNATAEVGLDEADWVEYLEAMLEASMLCAAWEVRLVGCLQTRFSCFSTIAPDTLAE